MVTSLPLMGIGNGGVWQGLTDAGFDLITPHGDRKPPQSPSTPSSFPRLITPHGDRKRCATTEQRSLLLPLITPPGDRKPVCEVHRYKPVSKLITPHGDRKPDYDYEDDSKTRTAHYPSWGSETR